VGSRAAFVTYGTYLYTPEKAIIEMGEKVSEAMKNAQDEKEVPDNFVKINAS
jgi:hypothetical protein